MPVQWPRGIRRGSTAARLVRLWVRITPGEWMFVCWEWCVSGWSLVQGSPTESGVCYQVRRADHSSRGVLLNVVCIIRYVELITRPEVSYREWCVLSGTSSWSLVQRGPTESGVCYQVRRADHSSRGVLPRVVCVIRYVELITRPEESYWMWCVLSGASGWSLVQRGLTKCGESECNHESSTNRRLWPTRVSCALIKKCIKHGSQSYSVWNVAGLPYDQFKEY
jgi:hypothetical protein